MKKKVGLVVGLATAAVLGTAPSASATVDLWAPIAPADTHVDGSPLTVKVIAPSHSWQIRRTARRMAAQLPSVDVVRSGPADLTVNVVVGWFDDDQQRTLAEGVIDLWSGLTTYNDEHTRTVYLNLKTTFKKGRKFVAAHEMGHAFGLAHNNTHHGVMNHSDWFDTTTMSPEEVAALEAAYAPLTD